MRLCPRSVQCKHHSTLQLCSKFSPKIPIPMKTTLETDSGWPWHDKYALAGRKLKKENKVSSIQTGPIRIMQRWSFQLCFAETAQVCSRTCQIPERRVFSSIPLKPSASVHGSTALGSRQPKDYPAGPLCLWWLVWHWSLCLSWHCLYRFHGSHSKESDTNIIRILICIVLTGQ